MFDPSDSSRPDVDGLAEFENLMKSMGTEEMIAKIEEITELDLEENTCWRLLNKFLRPLMDRDPELALRRLLGKAGPMKTNFIRAYAELASQYKPESAAQWAETLPTGSHRDATLKSIHNNWAKKDTKAAAVFALKLGID